MGDLRRFTPVAAVVAVVAVVLIGVFYYFGGLSGKEVFISPTQNVKIHYAGDESVSLSSITIKAFYFVPSDSQKSLDPDWQSHLTKGLDDVSKFYKFQLHGLAGISYEIYPQPIIGEGKRLVYDSLDTGGGNPHALIEIRKELLRRIFDRNGDLYNEDFVRLAAGSYEVIGIIYQGVGSSATLFTKNSTGDSHLIPIEEGEMPAFIVNQDYFVSPSYKDYGVTILAHEFGHTIGLVDAYDKDGNPTGDDIMGSGRYKPLDFAYISRDNRLKLGLSY